jgi:two-component system chemotaxis response regulator CheB
LGQDGTDPRPPDGASRQGGDLHELPPVVAMVCSAGGLQALQAVLEPLPRDFPAAVVVLQHQRPTGPGLLATILARGCHLPVCQARDGDELVAGRVLVVPPGKHALTTTHNTLALIDSDGPPPARPSADLLLSTLAVTAGRRAIAVVLSGVGTDGATGAVAIHDFGGTVIASDRASSEYFGMPSAAIGRDDAVDHIAAVHEIPLLLSTLCPAATRADGVAVDR